MSVNVPTNDPEVIARKRAALNVLLFTKGSPVETNDVKFTAVDESVSEADAVNTLWDFVIGQIEGTLEEDKSFEDPEKENNQPA